MVVLITGAAGFVGRHVYDYLHERGFDVIGIDNFDHLCGSDPSFPAANVDIRDAETLSAFIYSHGITDIVHLAAYGRNLTCQDHPSAAWDVNVTGTKNVLDAARIYRLPGRVIAFSSNIVLSAQATVYRSTKEIDEELIYMYSNLGVKAMGLRPANIYGPGQSKTEYQPCAFAGMDAYYSKNGVFQFTGDGTQTRDWVHVRDVARAVHHFLIYKVFPAGLTIDIATGKQTSLIQIADLLGVKAIYAEPRRGDALELISDTRSAEFYKFRAHMRLDQHIWEAFPSVVRP